MKNQNFTTTILVDQTPQDAFDAINNVRGWWAGELEGPTAKRGDEFTYRYKEFHYSKQKVTESVPGKRIVWQVLDARLNFVEDKSEWTGTQITFDIAKKGNKTEVTFTHVGLVPAVECYDSCSNAWGSIIGGSLKSLIATGKGEPEPKEQTC